MLSQKYLSEKMFYNQTELQGAFGSWKSAQELIDIGYIEELYNGDYMLTHTMLSELEVDYTDRLAMVMEYFNLDSEGEHYTVFIGDCFYGADGQWLALPIEEEALDAIHTAIDDYIVADYEGVAADNFNLSKLNEIAEYIEDELSDWDIGQFLAALADLSNFEDAQEQFEEYHLLCDSVYEWDQDAALVADWLECNYEVQQVIDDNCYVTIEDSAIARDMRSDYNLIEIDGSTYYNMA